MSVYVEVVLLNNLAVDALLVYAVLFLRRRKVRKLRFALAAAVGAAGAGGVALLNISAAPRTRMKSYAVFCF